MPGPILWTPWAMISLELGLLFLWRNWAVVRGPVWERSAVATNCFFSPYITTNIYALCTTSIFDKDFTTWSLRFAIVQNPPVWTPLPHGRFWGMTATCTRQAYRSRMDHSLTMIDSCTISLEILFISRHCVAQQIFARLIVSSCLVIGSAYSCWLSLHGSYWSMIWLTCNCVRNDVATDW